MININGRRRIIVSMVSGTGWACGVVIEMLALTRKIPPSPATVAGAMRGACRPGPAVAGVRSTVR